MEIRKARLGDLPAMEELSRVLFAPYEIPVGILLSFFGGPFFLFLILKQRRHHSRPSRKGASHD